MTATDPLEKRKSRLMLISTMNAWTVLIIALLFGGLSLIGLSLAGVLVGAGLVGAGLLEISGHRRLRAGLQGARSRMVGSQALLVLTVLAYCGWRLATFDATNPLAGMDELAGILQGVADMGVVDLAQLQAQVSWAYVLVYRLVALLTLVFQGGLGLYYWRSVGRVQSQSL